MLKTDNTGNSNPIKGKTSKKSHILVEERNKFLEFILFWRQMQIQKHNQALKLPTCSQSQILSNNFTNEIVLSPSGLAKLDNLDSCLSLSSSDFIVF